jgi:hypothetical protein
MGKKGKKKSTDHKDGEGSSGNYGDMATVGNDAAWGRADVEFDSLQRAKARHAELWALIDELTPKRDVWREKWQGTERLTQEDVSAESQMEKAKLRGPAATAESKRLFAQCRSLKASKKKMQQLDSEIFAASREILALEEKFAISSARVMNECMQAAIAADDPELLLQAMRVASSQLPHELQRRRVEVLASEVQRLTNGAGRGPTPLPRSAKEVDELFARSLREVPVQPLTTNGLLTAPLPIEAAPVSIAAEGAKGNVEA